MSLMTQSRGVFDVRYIQTLIYARAPFVDKAYRVVDQVDHSIIYY